MQNKKILIFLGLVLTIVIVFLMVYVYKINQEIIPETKNPTTSKTEVEKEAKQDNEDKDLLKIKKDMQNIQVGNETFEKQEEADIFSAEDKQRVEEYSKEVVGGNLRIAQGKIMEIQDSHLKIDFTQDYFNWQSTVIINSDTKISYLNNLQSLSLGDLKVGDSLIVRSFSSESVTNSEFIASKIFVE